MYFHLNVIYCSSCGFSFIIFLTKYFLSYILISACTNVYFEDKWTTCLISFLHFRLMLPGSYKKTKYWNICSASIFCYDCPGPDWISKASQSVLTGWLCLQTIIRHNLQNIRRVWENICQACKANQCSNAPWPWTFSHLFFLGLKGLYHQSMLYSFWHC